MIGCVETPVKLCPASLLDGGLIILQAFAWGCGLTSSYSMELVFVPALKCRMRTRPDLYEPDWQGLSACQVSYRLLSVVPFEVHVCPALFSGHESTDSALFYWTIECQVIPAACSVRKPPPPARSHWPKNMLLNASNTPQASIGQLLLIGSTSPPFI